MILRQTSVLFSLLMLLFFHPTCYAGEKEEITSLLRFIDQSECTFIRNSKQYDALAARQHIEKKYNYYKEQITTAEDFIRYSATKSSITGKPYTVLCNGVSMNSAEWLNAELERVRKR